MGDRKSTVYLTIMRDPVDIFVSAWYYYSLDTKYNMSIGQQKRQMLFKVYSDYSFLFNAM